MGALSTYLVTYNCVQAILWLSVLLLVGRQCFAAYSHTELRSLDTYICIVQSAMAIDVLNVLAGCTRGGIVTTTLQILSRVAVVWLAVPAARDGTNANGSATIDFLSHQCFTIMYVAWSFAEIIRYTYYLCKASPPKWLKWLKWLRYTAFYILYPAGVFTGEIPVIYLAWTRTVRPSAMWILYTVLLCAYVPGFPTLFMHMVKQRRRVLATTSNIIDAQESTS